MPCLLPLKKWWGLPRIRWRAFAINTEHSAAIAKMTKRSGHRDKCPHWTQMLDKRQVPCQQTILALILNCLATSVANCVECVLFTCNSIWTTPMIMTTLPNLRVLYRYHDVSLSDIWSTLRPYLICSNKQKNHHPCKDKNGISNRQFWILLSIKSLLKPPISKVWTYQYIRFS